MSRHSLPGGGGVTKPQHAPFLNLIYKKFNTVFDPLRMDILFIVLCPPLPLPPPEEICVYAPAVISCYAYPCEEKDPDADHEVGEPDGIAAVVGLQGFGSGLRLIGPRSDHRE